MMVGMEQEDHAPACGQQQDDQALHHRPMWQRLLLPFVGLLCVLVAAVGGFIPLIPGWPLALIGLPLLAAFNPRYEAWIRRKMRRAWCAIRRRFGRNPPDDDPAVAGDDPPATEQPSSRRVYRRQQPSPSD